MSFSNEIIVLINEFRNSNSLNELILWDNNNYDQAVYKSSYEVSNFKDHEDLIQYLKSEFEVNITLSSAVSMKHATHFNVNEIETNLLLNIYQYYAEINHIGPMINGKLVIQGTCIDGYGPSLCTIDHSVDQTNYSLAATIPPWQMDFSPSDGFTIMVDLGDDIEVGTIRIKVYVDQADTIPYECSNEDVQNEYETDPGAYIQAIEYTTETVSESDGNQESSDLQTETVSKTVTNDNNNPIQASNESQIDQVLDSSEKTMVVSDIKVVRDYEDIIELNKDGYMLQNVSLNESGVEREVNYLWKFQIMVKYGPLELGGLEEIEFITWPKEQTDSIVQGKEGFTVYSDIDLAVDVPDCEFSIFFAAKFGNAPQYGDLTMVYSSVADVDSLLTHYLDNSNSVFMKAPPEICDNMNGLAGIGLSQVSKRDASNNMNEGNSYTSENLTGDIESKRGIQFALNDSANNEDEELIPISPVVNANNSSAISDLQEQLEALQNQYTTVNTTNYELQRRCSELIQKESEIRSHSTAIKKLANAANTGSDDQNSDPSEDPARLWPMMINNLNEKKYKIEQQQHDFDQLALDLQTRLDDKDNKLKEVSNVFAKLKKDTLSQTINTTTGKRYTKKEIEDIDETEQKKYEVLEKVRIKNLSLRSHLKKIERVLRHREHLAEGLHVIDFEQLKIENQSLHEKIQERADEITKLKRKRTVAIQILTHIREKLFYLENTNLEKMNSLDEVEQRILRMRSLLSSVRQDRDELNQENKEMKTRSEFANSGLLVKDFGDRTNLNVELNQKLIDLQAKYDYLKTKVEEAKRSKTLTSRMLSSSTPYPPRPMHKPVLGPLKAKTMKVNMAVTGGSGTVKRSSTVKF